MRKINKFTAVLCVVIIAAGVFASCATKNPSDNSGEISDNSINIDNSSESISDNVSDNSVVLTESQEAELEALRKKGEGYVGGFVFQEKVITGEADPNAERMDLQYVKDVIKENVDKYGAGSEDCFNAILAEFERKQKYPDFCGGSGVSRIEYWFDPFSREGITLFLEQGAIRHFNGKYNNELLYN